MASPVTSVFFGLGRRDGLVLGRQELAAEQAAFDLPRGRILRVLFEALALEVLHREAGLGVVELLADREAEDGQPAVTFQ